MSQKKRKPDEMRIRARKKHIHHAPYEFVLRWSERKKPEYGPSSIIYNYTNYLSQDDMYFSSKINNTNVHAVSQSLKHLFRFLWFELVFKLRQVDSYQHVFSLHNHFSLSHVNLEFGQICCAASQQSLLPPIQSFQTTKTPNLCFAHSSQLLVCKKW